MSPRHQILTQGLALASLAGLEIGPLNHPIVRKTDGEITYIDYTNSDELRRKYAPDPNVNIEDIVEVDAIWGDNTLSEAIDGRKVDYIIASHVAEHVPDLIAWFEETRSVLRESGQLRLVLPDKRFSFDYLRTETDISAIVTAHLLDARRPQPHEVVDFKIHVSPGIDLRNHIFR